MNHTANWISNTNLTYNLTDEDTFKKGDYAYCGWGNRLSSSSVGDVEFAFNWLTAEPYTYSNTDLFITKKDLLERMLYSNRAFPTTTVWAPLQKSAFTSATRNDGKISFSAPSGTTNNLDLYRYLHFKNTLTDLVGGSTDPTTAKKIIILIHGWNPDANKNSFTDGDDPKFPALTSNLMDALAGSDWKLVQYRWEEDADTDNDGPIDNPTKAAEIGHRHGQHLGELLGKDYSSLQQVHLIAHSAGSWVARAAARYILKNSTKIVVQITLLDPFMPLELSPSPNTALGVSVMEGIAAAEGNSRLLLLENYYANDATDWVGDATQSVFFWGARGINRRVDGSLGSSDYNSHDGPVYFYSDTVYASIPGHSKTTRLANFDVRPNNSARIGWTQCLFYNEPIISAQPGNVTINSGESTTLSITANTRNGNLNSFSDAALSFQWYRGASGDTRNPIYAATTSSFPTPALSSTTDYWVRVIYNRPNSIGSYVSTDSAAATVTVTVTDTTPDAFAFTDVPGAEVNTPYTSNQIIVSGINAASAISIAGGSYSVNGGSYTTNSGSVVNGATVRVRQTSSGNYSTKTSTTLTIGGVSDSYDVTTKANAQSDTTPEAFAFTDVTGAEVSTLYTSNQITVSGINAASAISIAGGSYSVNGGSYTTNSGSVANGATVRVRQTSSGNYSTKTSTTLTIGGVSDSYDVTTKANAQTDTTPEAFAFTDVTGAEVSTLYTSNQITVSGINAASAISIAGGSYSVNGGNYTTASSTVTNGATVTVQQTSSGSFLTKTSVTLTIGGVSDSYDVTTKSEEPSTAVAYVFSTFAGQADVFGSADGLSSAARFSGPLGLTMDNAGNLYVADRMNTNIRKISSTGMVTTFAGSAGRIGSTDGTGSAALFSGPYGLTIDPSGNLYVADNSNHVIRKVTPGGVVTTVAGLAGSRGSSDGTSSNARFNYPTGITIDAAGNLFVTDFSNSTVRKITPGGVVTTLAGLAGSTGSTDGLGSSARFNGPAGLAIDAAGNLFIAEEFNHTIRKVTPGGSVSTVAGLAGISGSTDGTGSAARFFAPVGIAIDADGNLFVSEFINQLIRRVTPAGGVTTLGGMTGVSGSADGIGGAARFAGPAGIVASSADYIYVADYYNGTVRKGAPYFEDTEPAITVHPANLTVPAGGSTSFTVGATGTAPLTYRWQSSAPGSPGWTDLANGSPYSGVASTTLTITGATSALHNISYRCVVANAGGFVYSESAVLTVNASVTPPTITTHPADMAIEWGQNAAFTVGVSGAAPFTYYWQVSAPGADSWSDLTNDSIYNGVNTATLTVTRAGTAQIGNSYRCQVFNSAGWAVSNGAVLTVRARVTPPSITLHPDSRTITAGQSTTFIAWISGTAPFTYYWQVSTPGSGGWTDLTNSATYSWVNTATLANSTTLTITGATTGLNGYSYRCQVFNSAGYAVSNGAVLTVNAPAVAPTMTAHPANKTVTAGGSTSFMVGVSGTAPLAYYWQVSAPGSTSWTDLTNSGVYSGVNTATLTIAGAATGLNGNYYRCQVFNSAGYAVSNGAVLTVNPPATPPTIGTHPANKTVTAGGSTSFTVGVGGTAPLAYYWQVSAPGSTGWTDLADGGVYSGTRTTTLTVTGAPAGLNGYYYRCQVFNSAGYAVSNGAVLTVNAPATPPTITTHPADMAIEWGQNAAFTVGVSGTAPFTYYWQVSAPGADSWSDLTNDSIYNGVNTATLTVTRPGTGQIGNSYRCQVFNSAGWAVSNGAVLTVRPRVTPPSITLHPDSRTITAGQSATFTVWIGGTAPFTYYWQVSTPGSGGWSDLTNSATYSWVNTATLANSTTLTITGATTGLNGNSYRCQVFNSAGWAVSNGAVLTVNAPATSPTISTHPANKTVVAGGSTSFTVTAGGSPTLLYYWQVSAPGSTSWTDLTNGGVYSGANTATLTITGATTVMNGNVYRCVIFNSAGHAVSDWARLTVGSALVDFNGDGKSDLIWQNVNGGDFGVWLMNGTTNLGWVTIDSTGPNWIIRGTGDFNGDGKPDLIWQNVNGGDFGVWLMDGTTNLGWVTLGTTGPNWIIRGAGDFNGDGKSDLIWQHVNGGDFGVWLMDGTTNLGWVTIDSTGPNWIIRGAADFNGDGKSDLIWQHVNGGDFGVWLMDGTTNLGWVTLGTTGPNWIIRGTGDFNGDGKPDLIWQHVNGGDFGVWLMDGTTNTGWVTIDSTGPNWIIRN